MSDGTITGMSCEKRGGGGGGGDGHETNKSIVSISRCSKNSLHCDIFIV